MNEHLRVTSDFVIPASELHWRFDTSGGPGGQHAARSATRAELSFDLAESVAIDEATKARITERLGKRVVDGVLAVAVHDSRSQWRNRQLARSRLRALLLDALREPVMRKQTKPSNAARQRRIAAKRAQSEKKRLRKPPEHD